MKEIHWLWKIDLYKRKIQQKYYPEEKVIGFTPRENKQNNNNGKFFKG